MKQKEFKKNAICISLITNFLFTIIGSALAGIWLEKKFHLKGIGILSGFALGIGLSAHTIYKLYISTFKNNNDHRNNN